MSTQNVKLRVPAAVFVVVSVAIPLASEVAETDWLIEPEKVSTVADDTGLPQSSTAARDRRIAGVCLDASTGARATLSPRYYWAS